MISSCLYQIYNEIFYIFEILFDLFNNPDNIETDTSIVDTNSIESINETLDGQSMQP